MDVTDILKDWPELQRAGAETLFASPAWRLTMRIGATEVTVSRGAILPEDALVLDVTLDDEPTRLAIADTPAFPDLHLLWARRGELPESLLLAIVEKECGSLFTLIEGFTRRLFALKGLASSTEGLRPLSARGEGVSFDFALGLPASLVTELGRLENLDTAHEAIRGLTRPVRAVHGLLLLTDEELAALKPGDFVLLPEEFGKTAKWETREALAAGSAVAVTATEEMALSFATFADGTFPPIPAADEMELVRGDKTLFKVTRVRIGMAAALRIQ